MKKTIQFVFIVLLVIFNQSCSSDDDGITERINETFIDGKWKLVKTTKDGSDITLNNCDKMNTIEFNDSSDQVIQKTYALNDSNACEIDTESSNTYVINGDTIEISNTTDFEIEIGNNDTLLLKYIQNGVAIVNTYNRS